MSNLACAERRHQNLWLEDGNVIVFSEDTVFKVHRSILTRMSPFFRSQFSQTELELFDGLPSIRLEVGIANSKDVEALLQHLYHDKPLHSSSPFDQTARILRACTQYDFLQVRKLALDRLKELYPRRPAPFECIDWQYLPEASQLALDCRAREVLPALLYGMVTTLDFDIEESPSEHSESSPIPLDNAKVIPIPRLDMHRLCAQLMNRMMEHFAPILFTVPTSSHMECTGVFADHWMDFAIQPALDDSGVYKPLETLKKFQQVDWRSLGLCEACCEDKAKEWADEADDIWSRMDSWVDLDNTFPAFNN